MKELISAKEALARTIEAIHERADAQMETVIFLIEDSFRSESPISEIVMHDTILFPEVRRTLENKGYRIRQVTVFQLEEFIIDTHIEWTAVISEPSNHNKHAEPEETTDNI